MPNDLIATIIEMVADANDQRLTENLERRILKFMEELGELAEAFLECTSQHNRKCKTWDDVKEEAADVLIVAIDIALTPLTVARSHGQLVDAVKRQLYRINTGFPAMMRQLCYSSAHYGGDFHSEPEKALQHIVETVCYAFALNELMWRIDDADKRAKAIIDEVARKLAKWRTGTSTAEEVNA